MMNRCNASTRLVAAAGLPVRPPPEMTAERFMEVMAVDKKVIDGQLRLVLMRISVNR